MKELVLSRTTVHLLLVLLFAIPLFAYGQSLSPGTDATLSTDPAYPAPNSTITVHLEAYSVNLNGAQIQWFINGAEDASAANARSVSIETGESGSETRVRAVVTTGGVGTFAVEKAISPSAIDLIVEPNTRTPSFYKGRTLPAADEAVTVTAIPHVAGDPSANSLVYTWTLGDTVLEGGAVQGLSRVTFTMPRRDEYLYVEVSNSSGRVLGGNAILLSAASPELYFYEDNPLRGIRENAIGSELILSDSETTVRAEPYYVSKDIFLLSRETGWTIDSTAANHGDDIRTLTLRSTGGSGTARIGFGLINPRALLQTISKTFTIYFE